MERVPGRKWTVGLPARGNKSMDQIKITLEENEMPRQWYNLAADLPNPPLPPLGPDGKPIGPEMLGPPCFR